MRGTIIPMTPEGAVKRARGMVGPQPLPKPAKAPPGTKEVPLQYRLLAGHNGGKDPTAAHPGSTSYGERTWTADCMGFVAWCMGFDRYQPQGFPLWSGWINGASAIADSKKDRLYFKDSGQEPLPGDVVVYGGYGGKIGHIGLVVSVPEGWQKDVYSGSKAAHWAKVGVVHCSAGHQRKLGYAVAEDNAAIFSTAGKNGTFLRYTRYV